MAYYLVKDFQRGLDVRRMVETTEAGSLIRAKNCVVTRGGELEKRKAWNKIKDLPYGTFGLHVLDSLFGDFHVFGSKDLKASMPNGVTYHRLQHPTVNARMTGVLCVEYFNGYFFVVASYVNGDIINWSQNSDGDFVAVPRPKPNEPPPTDPDDAPVYGGRATIEIEVERTAAAGDGQIRELWVFQQVPSTTPPPGDGDGDGGGGAGGGGAGGGGAGGGGAGGPDAEIQRFASAYSTDVYKPAIDILFTSTQTEEEIASAIATAVNATTTVPNFNAKADGKKVYLAFQEITSKYNGYMFYALIPASTPLKLNHSGVFTGGQSKVDGDTDALPALMSGSLKTDTMPYSPAGRFVKPFKSVMWAVTGVDGLLRGSLPNNAQIWDPSEEYLGLSAREIPHLSEGSQAFTTLTSIGIFQDKLAVFAGRAVYIWAVDPDPLKDQLISKLKYTGTYAPRSVVSWGNTDVFYLDRTGIRSLQSRNVTGAAFSSDVGNPIDDIVQEAYKAAGYGVALADATIDPDSGRYVLALGKRMFVFSFFAQSKISAWTEWELDFNVQDLAISSSQMFAKSGNAIYAYGEWGGSVGDYDDCPVEVQLPYMSAGMPATHKSLYGVDVALQNQWHIEMGTDYTNESLLEDIGIVGHTTYSEQRVAVQGYATHVSFRLTCNQDGYARLGNLAWHYQKGEEPG